MRLLVSGLSAAAVLTALMAAPSASMATVIYTSLATPLTTPINLGGGNADGTGVWFNPLTRSAEVRGTAFPGTLFEDGKFFLLFDAFNYATPEAEIFTQGFFSRGNGVVYASASNLNPAKFGAGASIGANSGFQSPGAGYPDLGPNFGNWTAGDHAFIGLTLRDPTGTSSGDIFYGYADITLGADYSVTLNAFAYENTRRTAITTSFAAPVPEPATALSMAVGVIALLGLARRHALRAI